MAKSNNEPDVIDVSVYQGSIDWTKVKGDGNVAGAIIRIGYGDNLRSQDDVYAKRNLDECERLGIVYMAYLYSYADSDAHIQSEIEHMQRMIAGYNPVGIVLDTEEWRYKSFAKKAAKAWTDAFGDKAIIYAGQSYWRGPLKDFDCNRWIPAYGYNSGKPEMEFKPPFEMDGWQYTSRGTIRGISGNVDLSKWYADHFSDAGKSTSTVTERRPVYKKEVAALLMLHQCAHDAHGYTQDMDGRQGTGEETVVIYGHEYKLPGGDRDCSSAIIIAYEAAGIYCGGATYTGNMERCMTATGNFVKRPMSFIAQMGDSYLVHDEKGGRCHTAMCLSADPDVLMEFSINEHGGTLGGKIGDQLQNGEYDYGYGSGESHVAPYYDYGRKGWDCILECTNDEVAFWIGPDTDAGNPADASDNAKPEPVRGITEAVMAAETILGDYGNGQERRNKLGENYDEVQGIVTNVVRYHRDGLIKAMAEYINSIRA